MDIRAWERRASAYDGPYPGYADEDEGYYEDSAEVLSPDDYEEMLFQRVLDKIRIARAAGNQDVQLSTEELDAYQSKLHGARTPAARPRPISRPADTSVNDAGSVTSAQPKHAHSSSRSKREKQRSGLLGSKSKKDKSSHRKRVSASSSVASHPPAQTSPGFMVPGPDGQPIFAPINAYQGNLSRDQLPSPRDHLNSSRPTSRSLSGTHPPQPAPQLTPPPRDMPPPQDVVGAFPGSEHAYRPPSPTPHPLTQPQPPHVPPLSARQQAYARERQLEAQGLISTTAQQQAARGVPFPVEMYQYQAFTPSSASPTSPQTQYVRRVSSGGLSEASYTSMPRRVPVPVSAPAHAPVPLQRSLVGSPGFAGAAGEMGAGATVGLGVEVGGMDVGVGSGAVRAAASGGGGSSSKDGERRRKSGKAKKKG
ncbi:hypothetical protein J1614_012124 [Plenodomus biglobosus]|nr:hypothetical protein J1614_012124 [Plenodomus biglobosus]